MIESNAQRLEASRCQFTQVHSILTEDARVNTLVESNTSLYGYAHSIALEHGATIKTKIPDLDNNVLETWVITHVPDSGAQALTVFRTVLKTGVPDVRRAVSTTV